jgi:hypothetical protein
MKQKADAADNCTCDVHGLMPERPNGSLYCLRSVLSTAAVIQEKRQW